MGKLLSPDHVFDFLTDESEPQYAYDFFAPRPLPDYAGNPNNMNGWIEADVPLLGELGEMGETLGAEHKREYDSWVNERQMQTTEEKVDTSKALNVSMVDKESSGTESKEQDTCSRSRNDAHAGDADIRPIYDEVPMAESQFLKDKSNEAKFKHDIDVVETINIKLEHKVAKLLKENETLKKHYKELFDSIKITRAKTIEYTTSLIATNDKFKAQLQEKGFTIVALKNKLRKLKGNSVNTKFAKQSIMGKPMLQSYRNQSVVRQPTTFKSERPRISKPWCDSQVDVNNDLSKPVTIHYLPKEREAASVKPYHMIASSNFRISSKNMPRFSSNDMVHNHYLEESKKKTQECSRNSKPSLMPFARSQSTAKGSKPKPRSNTQTSRNWPTSKNSFVTTKTVPIAEHFRNFRNFFDSKHFVCSTCQKCVFDAHHDSCLTKLLYEVDSRAKVPSNKTTNKNKPVEQISVPNKQERHIPIGHSFSIKKTSVVQKITMTPRSCLSLELGIHDHSNEQSSSKLVPKVVPSADKTATSRQDLKLLFHHHITMLRSTFYQGILLASFQDDAKYEHGGQDTRSQGGKDDQDWRINIKRSQAKLQSQKTMTKAKDQRSQSMKEQAYNVDRDEDKSLTTKAILLISRRTTNSLRGRFDSRVTDMLVDPVIDELAEPIVEVEEQMVAPLLDIKEDLAMSFGVEDDSSDDDFEEPEGDEEVHMPSSVIEDLCTRMGNLEYVRGLLVKKVITVSDAKVANGIAIREIGPKGQQATTQRDEAIVGLSQQCILGLDRLLADVERRSSGPC
uniref:Uncharacterized protein n=1 Tax=Tanacetum cinerariifolium TaxID=118510 RepID=A0A6L2J1J7_TANCI|nr:hypothetical protein [Tanacetum cinerariifolium]